MVQTWLPPHWASSQRSHHCPCSSTMIQPFGTFANETEETPPPPRTESSCLFNQEFALPAECYIFRGVSPRHSYNLFFMFMVNFCLSKPATSYNNSSVTNRK